MLRWLFSGGGDRVELSVTEKIRAQLAADAPDISSIYKAYAQFPVELNAVLLEHPKKVRLFVEKLIDKDAIAFVTLLTDDVIEKVTEDSKDEQQPFYLSSKQQSYDLSDDRVKQSSIAFLKRIPKSYLTQISYLKNSPSPILEVSLFAALIDKSFPESIDDWRVIQPLLLAGLAKNPHYLRKIMDALDEATAFGFAERLPTEVVEYFLQFNSEGDSFVLNTLDLDPKIASVLISKASNSLAADIATRTYMSGQQVYYTIFSLYPAVLLSTFIGKHEKLIKDQLREKTFAMQMLDYLASLQQKEFVAFTKALPAIVLKFILEQKTTKGEAFLALAVKHQDRHVLDKIASEELYDAFQIYIQNSNEKEVMSNLAWFGTERLAYFQIRLQKDNTISTLPLQEKLAFIIKRMPADGEVDISTVEKAFNSYQFLRHNMLSQLIKIEWAVPPSMLSMLWSSTNEKVRFDITLDAKKLPASAKTAFQFYEKINDLIRQESQGMAVDWLQEERNILNTLKYFCINQTSTKPSVALSGDEKTFYEGLHSSMVDRQSAGPKVKIFLSKR